RLRRTAGADRRRHIVDRERQRLLVTARARAGIGEIGAVNSAGVVICGGDASANGGIFDYGFTGDAVVLDTHPTRFLSAVGVGDHRLVVAELGEPFTHRRFHAAHGDRRVPGADHVVVGQ